MSKFLKLNVRDFVKGLIVAILTGILTFLTDALARGEQINIDFLKRVGLSAAIAFIAYLIKNIFTNSTDKILTTEK